MRCGPGWTRYTGDAVAIMMADLSDSPRTSSATTGCSSRATTAPSEPGSARGAGQRGYPRVKLVLNRIVNAGIRLLFQHGYNDTTNAFKAYRREVIEQLQPLLSNHFNLTVEIPLKAVVRGYSYAVVPVAWTNRRYGDSKLKLPGDGQPLPVHRPLRVARTSPQPRRLPA